MPVQTTKKNVLFPDGCQVSVKAEGDASYTDIGAINSATTANLTFDENQIETANAGNTDKQINNMKMEGGFDLINWQLDVIEKISGGVMSLTTTAASPTSSIPDQTISSGWADNTAYPLVAQTSSSDSTELKLDSAPVLTSVTLDPTGTPEVLAEDTEYVIIADNRSSSGWSIQFISGNMSTASPTTYDIVIAWGTNTPRASSTINAGSSTVILRPMVFKFEHTDGNGKVRRLDLWSVDPNSGFLSFDFKGANEDGLETIPVTFMSKIDTSRTDGQQLMSFTIEEGAQ